MLITNKYLFLWTILFLLHFKMAFSQQTPYEIHGKNYTATYQECIDFYKQLDEEHDQITMLEMGMTDAGLPLHIVLLNQGMDWNPAQWHRNRQVVILINNGIHPGEPDGIDASMMLVRNLAKNQNLPSNVVLAIIPVYNIGGCLNRSAFNRVDQEGPESFGSRGNSQNLDLNRDFIKCDSKEARAFTELFQWLQPDIFIDNHVSDGADYPYVMTLASTQHQKLGKVMGPYLQNIFEPALYRSMKANGNPIIPYVNVWGKDAKEGWTQFFDSPRYSTGYAALFHTFGFTPETHMLKPYPLRVQATLQLMESIIGFSTENADDILNIRKKSIEQALEEKSFPINWQLDETQHTDIDFDGYAYKTKTSAVSELPVKYYDRQEPYTTKIKFNNYYSPSQWVDAPTAYIIPQGWWKVIELLQLNGVEMKRLKNDTTIEVEAYHIKGYQSTDKAYEGHHTNQQTSVEKNTISYAFRKGDYTIPTYQQRKRYLIETLEPHANDSYFAWNFFDAILVQKEGYSDYAYEALAAQYLIENPVLKSLLIQKRKEDPSFAASASKQLDFVFKHSPYYEKGHNLYPVFRINEKQKENTEKSDPIPYEFKNKKDE